MSFITEIRKVFAGLIKDVIPENIPKNRFIDGENFNLTQSTNQTKGGATPALGNETVITNGLIDFATDQDDYKGYRILLDTTTAGISHDFILKTSDGGTFLTFSISSSLLTPQLRYDDLVAQITSNVSYLTVYIPNPPDLVGGPTAVYVGLKIQGFDFLIEETVSSIPVELFVIKEFYGIAHNGPFVPLKSLNIGDNLYVIATNGSVVRLNVGVKDEETQAWTYTAVLQTKQIILGTDAIIDLDGQIDFGTRVSLYFTGAGYLPRTFYVTRQDPWQVDSTMVWNEDPTYIQEGNPIGIYTYENIEANTRLQVIENFATISLVQVNNSGGSLTTGNKMYVVRQRITINSYTGFSLSSGPVEVFSDSLFNIRLKGNEGGEPSSKSITLQISNLNPKNYDEFELVVIENIDGAFTAKIVGSYKITGDVVTITHTGNEFTSSIPISEIATQQIVFDSAANLVINRNRLFISNTEIQNSPDISEWAKTITIETDRKLIDAIGILYGTVNEYQKPENTFYNLGYPLEETDRFAIIPFYKNGFIGEPVFIKDHKWTYPNADLTIGSGGEPKSVYVFYAKVTLDLSTAPPVNGVPFADSIYGYSIVRRENIPEVYGGIVLPATSLSPLPIVGNFTVGGFVYPHRIHLGDFERLFGAFICPDVLFGAADINPLSSDKILNYGQPNAYYERSENPTGDDECVIVEYDGDASPTYEEVPILSGQTIEFNAVSSDLTNGISANNPYSTLVTGSFTKLNQKSTGLGVNGNINVITNNRDDGFYLAKYITPRDNKYGEPNQGSYISCGHLRKVEKGTNVYTDDIFGGYVFTQKTIIKFCNEIFDGTAEYQRVGVSFYSNNRVNSQMRYIDSNVTFKDFPYTTTSLVTWLSGDPAGSAKLYPGTLTYSPSYTPINQYQQFQAYDPDLPVQSALTNTVFYSQEQIEGALGDAMRVFLPLNSKAYPLVYGAIKNTFRNGNNLMILMESAVLLQDLDLQQQQTDPNGITIIIGDGTVLGARERVLTLIGAPTKTGAMQYLSNKGYIYTMWYNHNYNKLFRFASDGVNDMGVDNLCQSFLTQNGQYLGAERSVVFGYDYYTSEAIMATNAEIPDSVPFDMDVPYMKGQIVFYGGYYTTKKYFIAKMDVPEGKDPSYPANQLQYWEHYRNSNYTLAYNEELNQFSCFYSYTPVLFMPYKKTFLTFASPGGLSPYLYEHNRFTNKFYEDNILAYVTIVCNDQSEVFKTARDIFLQMKNKPVYMIIRGINGSQTYGVPDNIIQKRDYWWQNVRNDATFSSFNPMGLNTLDTQRTGGETIEITIYWNNSTDELNTLKEIVVNMIPKSRLFFT